jgi:hypothetical protein
MTDWRQWPKSPGHATGVQTARGDCTDERDDKGKEESENDSGTHDEQQRTARSTTATTRAKGKKDVGRKKPDSAPSTRV